MSQELILEESRFAQFTSVQEQYKSLRISNVSETIIDTKAMLEHIQQVKFIDRIEKLTINYNSSLTDLNILRAFTNLKILYVYGQHIKSLDGIKFFSKGEYLKIQTHRNRRRIISHLAQTRVKRIDLFVERFEDLQVIAECTHLQTIDIYHSMEPNFADWKEVPLETISFKSCKFTELGNVSYVSSLNDLSVLGCRNLERFTGDNSNIKRLVIDNCKRLDLSTLKTFEEIEVLIINSCTKEMNLTEISGLKYVKHIDFILCNVQVNLIDLKEHFPNIESLHISGMKKEYGFQLKQLNPDIQITSRSFDL